MTLRKGSCRLHLDHPRTRVAMADGRVRVQLDEDLGRCHHDSLQLEPGLSLGRLHYQPSRRLIEESCGPHEGRVMVVTLGLQGKSGFTGREADLVFQAGHATVTAFGATPGERRYEADQAVTQLRLVIDEATLGKYLGARRAAEMLGDGRLTRLAFRPASDAAMAHAAALVRYLSPGVMSPDTRLDLHIHALSLLSEQSSLSVPPQRGVSPLSAMDVERVERARDLLGEQLHKPLTVKYLAATVGINEHKLKEGFRCLFDSTPARILLELRMRRAMTLLEAGQQVGQVAWQVGYSYPNNFTVAFTRYFGRSPKSIFGRQC